MDRPILFSGPMVRAILDGRKTQTRRLMKYPPRHNFPEGAVGAWCWSTGRSSSFGVSSEAEMRACKPGWCEYGGRGDRLWVRETFCPMGSTRPAGYWTDPKWRGRECFYAADNDRPTWAGKWKPSIFMPRALSRITLRVESVRVERLQEISEEDAGAEGVDMSALPEGASLRRALGSNRNAFRILWDSINRKRAPWESNPWVWVVSFNKEAPRE